MSACNEESKNEFISDKALLMMTKMGYKMGTSLGKHEENILNSVNLQRNLGKRGFGFTVPHLEASDAEWDYQLESINVREEVLWLSNNLYLLFKSNINFDTWIVRGPRKLTTNDEVQFCQPEILQSILDAKGKFDELDSNELIRARARANPFEKIRSAFFMNRAALKMANIDAITDFMFTEIDRNPNHQKRKGPYYFADVCAGPGGFSEYILWRKKWLFKGFGFTLRGEHDFELSESCCSSPVTFAAQYGIQDDGDACCPDNIKHFAEHVLHETDGLGVHFMMSDGGFSVEGNENLQEILSKQLYVCQCLMALEIVRVHGHFVTKLFDLFTSFSIGLIYIMYNCFEKISIIKPNASRPANSERYLVCYGMKTSGQTYQIRKYLFDIARELWELRQAQENIDINEIVPLSVIKADTEFYKYIIESNNRLGSKQVIGLSKLISFCQNPTLVEPRQDELRAECLKFWRIPDLPKIPLPRFTTDDLLQLAVNKPGFMYTTPKQIGDVRQLPALLEEIDNWNYIISGCHRRTNICNFYAGVGCSRVYRLQGHRWVKVNKLQLVRGTLLYGEMVKETVVENCDQFQKYSLHVIDALRLGDTSLADLPFNERLDLIDTYCQAVNHESQTHNARIRAKTAYSIKELSLLSSLFITDQNESSYVDLPILGFNSVREYYKANSIIFLNIGADQLFRTTFTSRIQVYVNNDNKEDQFFCDNQIILNSLIHLGNLLTS